jgi:hypothetical protein
LNSTFVRHARRQGIDASVLDLNSESVPPDDYVVVQGSLYHFIPGQREILEKLLEAGRKRIIVSERTGGLTKSRSSAVAWFARMTTDPGTGAAGERFDRESLLALFRAFPGRLMEIREYSGGKEIIAVFRGTDTE